MDMTKSLKCARCGNPFDSNVMIKGDDCCRSCERLNDMTFWFPVLFRSGIPVPKTVIIHTSLELLQLLDHKKPKGFDDFLNSIKDAIRHVGLPAFIRTGYTSNKHDWESSCFIKDEKDVWSHIFNLVEFSCMATVDRIMPYDFWAVREFIKTEPYFHYFHGKMPITKERRYFVRNGKIECRHSYWPEDVFKGIDGDLIERLNSIDEKEEKTLDSMAAYISNKFSGYWSIDFLRGADGQWWVTDMAIAEKSYHPKH